MTIASALASVVATVATYGNAATKNVGTTAGTVAAGDDSRITGAAQKSSNLSDLANAGTSRTNLGLGGAAVLAVGTGSGDVAAGNRGMPTGGADGDVLTKTSGTDYAVAWETPSAGGGLIMSSLGSDVLVPTHTTVTTAFSTTIARIHYSAVYLPTASGGWDRIYAYLSTGQTATTGTFAVYTATAAGLPGTKVTETAGTTSLLVADQGAVYGTISLSSGSAPAGWYFLAFVAAGTAPSMRAIGQPVGGMVPSVASASATSVLNTNGLGYIQSSSASFPTTATPTISASAVAMAIRSA